MSKSFLKTVASGKNDGWLYVTVIGVIAWYWFNISGYVAWYCQAIFSWFFKSVEISYFISVLFPFIPILAFLIFAVQRLHKRKFASLINSDASLKPKRLFLGFGVWGLLTICLTLFDIVANSQNYEYTFSLASWLLLLPFALVLIIIQTSTEEFFYRGYLMQGLSLLTRHPLLLILLTSILFAVPHFGNPEMQRGFIWTALTYFLWGVFFATITLKDNGLELVLGAHAANNLFSFLVVNTSDAGIPTPAFFTYTGAIDAREGLLGLLIQASLFYAIFFGGVARNPGLK